LPWPLISPSLLTWYEILSTLLHDHARTSSLQLIIIHTWQKCEEVSGVPKIFSFKKICKSRQGNSIERLGGIKCTKWTHVILHVGLWTWAIFWCVPNKQGISWFYSTPFLNIWCYTSQIIKYSRSLSDYVHSACNMSNRRR
jgi:hypothetical protein